MTSLITLPLCLNTLAPIAVITSSALVRPGTPLSVTPDQDLDVQETLLRASGMWV